MSDVHLYPVPESFKTSTTIDLERYTAMYEQSITDPDSFWAEQAKPVWRHARDVASAQLCADYSWQRGQQRQDRLSVQESARHQNVRLADHASRE